jgi:hypothetical protein
MILLASRCQRQPDSSQARISPASPEQHAVLSDQLFRQVGRQRTISLPCPQPVNADNLVIVQVGQLPRVPFPFVASRPETRNRQDNREDRPSQAALPTHSDPGPEDIHGDPHQQEYQWPPQ